MEHHQLTRSAVKRTISRQTIVRSRDGSVDCCMRSNLHIAALPEARVVVFWLALLVLILPAVVIVVEALDKLPAVIS